MSTSPLEHSASLRIGVVEFVSPDKIEIALDLEAPSGVAGNAGVPRPFPRINNYILVAAESGYVVAQIEWITIEQSTFSKHKGLRDHGLVDLPFPLRKMRANPLGVLSSSDKKTDKTGFVFKRGLYEFPFVGEPVLIPTDEQLRAIVESGENKRVKIGTSPMAANADVCIDPDKLFGRHLAVLGNTGSGKSCTIAGLVKWSIEASKGASTNKDILPNARFIILDTNGEYSRVFQNQGRIFRVNDEESPLEVPLWFWNSGEWSSFSQASSRAQAPLLKQALRAMRNEEFEYSNEDNIIVKKFLGSILITAKDARTKGLPWASFPKPKGFYDKVCTWHDSLLNLKSKLEVDDTRLDDLIDNVEAYKNKRSGQYPVYDSTTVEITEMIEVISSTHTSFGGAEHELLPKSEDTPIKFPSGVFVDYLEALAQEAGSEQYVEFLLARIRTMLADTRMKSIVGDDIDISLSDWLGSYIGDDDVENGCVTIIDLSLVPSEIIHIVTTVVARIVFEALQRYRKINGNSLPTVLVMEEAHTYIRRYRDDLENQTAASICCQMFEKISREGRKFGLGLVLSSQRPSELSPTVLSQCNSFLLHRISNDRDQELIHRLVPDNLRGLLHELPSLPSQQAILLGWASELPTMVRINDLQSHERPHSDDPDFWDVWSRFKERAIDWERIAKDWQQISENDSRETDDRDDQETDDRDDQETDDFL